MLDLLKLRFNCLNRNITLRVFAVTEKELKTLIKNNDASSKAAGIIDLPEDSARLLDDEIKGEEEYNASLRAKKADIEDSPFDFDDNTGFQRQGSMGQANMTIDNQDDDIRASVMVGSRKQMQCKLSDFEFKLLLGRGTFGKVFLAELRGSKKMYAIKTIRKDVLIEYNQVQNTKLEKDILLSCDHPNLVGMDYLFQSPTRLYFVMPFVKGGELYKVFKAQKRLTEPVVKFYTAQIILAVGYLHDKGIMHRDLKLENILVDEMGYLKIIDYGLAKTLQENQVSKTFCGTPEYLAPEMVLNQGHDLSVDWWALGILIYEMLIGVTPFYNKERRLLLMKIRTSKVVFPDKRKYKIDYSDDFVDIVMQLLNKEKKDRLGSKDDSREILKHPWFSDLDIAAVFEQSLKPPLQVDFNVGGEGKFDTRFFNSKANP